MPQTLTFYEADIIKLILEFLEKKDLCISMLSLERETGTVNGVYSEDMLFFRQVVLEGHVSNLGHQRNTDTRTRLSLQWDDALEYLDPLNSANLAIDLKPIRYLLLKHKYLELLCIKSEGINFGSMDSGFSVDEVSVGGTGHRACMCMSNGLARCSLSQVTSCLKQLEQLCPTSDDYKELCYLLSLPSLSHHEEYQNWNPSISRVHCFNKARIDTCMPH